MSKRWLWRALMAAAVPAALAVGCAQKTVPPQPVAPPPTTKAPATKATVKGGKVQESTAVQMARKLGTPTKAPVVTTSSGLMYIDAKVGKGDPAKAGETVAVHYTGWLDNGTKFDSSKDRGQPFAFALGGGQVIRGWDEGVQGMKPGGIRKLIIPSDLGYGPGGRGPIPPNATLIFEVEYLGKQ